MNTDYMTQVEHRRHEAELAETLERRRVAAERDAMRFDGDRLALMAHVARAARATRVVTPEPVSC